jgi:transposase
MQYYAGIDLHARNCVVCITDEQEKKLITATVPNHLPSILSLLEKVPNRPSVAIEATLNWYWLVDGLQEAGYNVKLAHTMGLYMISGAKVKTDRRDAFALAKLLRLNAIPEAYIYPKHSRPIRDLLRRRTRMVRLRAEAFRAIKVTYQKYGIPYCDEEKIWRADEEQVLRCFKHPAIHAGLELELERIRIYSRELDTVEKYILSTVKNKRIYDHLQTIPGVGKILALTIYYEVGEVTRFGSSKQFCSYARVVPGIAQSGNVSRRGRASKQGNPHLKWSFNQAALNAVRHYGYVRSFRQKHLNRRRSKAKRMISLSIVAHKLAIGAYHVQRDKVPFNKELMFDQTR